MDGATPLFRFFFNSFCGELPLYLYLYLGTIIYFCQVLGPLLQKYDIYPRIRKLTHSSGFQQMSPQVHLVPVCRNAYHTMYGDVHRLPS
jgi:hypothetical protein